MISPEGIVTTWNAGAQRFKGYRADEIIGQHFSRFYTEEDRQSGLPSRALETAARAGQFEQEGWRVRRDGTRMWAHVVMDPIWRGELVGFAKVTRDITEKREAQEALEKTRAALFQSQKMETVGQLTGGIAHDLAGQTGSTRLTVATEATERMASLSTREREVLDLLSQGKPNKVIAHELDLSPRTVEMHRARMLERLGCEVWPRPRGLHSGPRSRTHGLQSDTASPDRV